MAGLSAPQKQQYEEQGFVVFERLFDPDELRPLIAELEGDVDRLARRYQAEGRIKDLCEGQGFKTRLIGLFEQCEAMRDEVVGSRHIGPATFNLLKPPKLVDIAESIVGPEVQCQGRSRFRPQIPGSERSKQFNRIAPSLNFGFGTFPLPPNSRRSSFGGPWTWVMPKESRLRDGAWLFLEEALSEENNLKFADRYDRVPVRQSVTQLETYLKSDPFRKLVLEEAPGRKWLITAPGANGVRADIMAVATDILQGGMPPADALNKAQIAIQQKLDDALRPAR